MRVQGKIVMVLMQFSCKIVIHAFIHSFLFHLFILVSGAGHGSSKLSRSVQASH